MGRSVLFAGISLALAGPAAAKPQPRAKPLREPRDTFVILYGVDPAAPERPDARCKTLGRVGYRVDSTAKARHAPARAAARRVGANGLVDLAPAPSSAVRFDATAVDCPASVFTSAYRRPRSHDRTKRHRGPRRVISPSRCARAALRPLAEHLRRHRARRYRLPRRIYRQLGSSVLRGATLRSDKRDGRMLGLRLRRASRCSLLRLVGLRPGDLLVRLVGVTLDSPAAVRRAQSKLPMVTVVTIGVARGTRTFSVQLELR